MVPSGVGFNDQLLVLTGKTASCMENLLDSVLMYMREKVPLTPETLLYYHLVVNNHLKVQYIMEWPYEIVRSDDVETITVTDLMIMDLIDKYHPVVKARISRHPIKYLFKYGRIRWRAFVNRYLR